MASNTIASASTTPQEQHGEAATGAHQNLENKLNLLKKQIQDERIESIKEKLQRNEKNLQYQLSEVMSAILRNSSLQNEENTVHMLSSRIDHPLCKFRGFSQGLGENNHINNQDVPFVKSIEIPYIERLPPYTFWIHLARNERMAEDQSIVGKRKIYYDQHGGEALICSDSDEELKEHGEVKHNFSQCEDQILRMAFEEHGLTEEVLSTVTKFIGCTNSKIQERYKILKEKDQHSEDSGEHGSHTGICLDRSLSATLDTFDHLFCRRCMQIYDCPLHGCSQPLIYPSEKQPVWSEPEADRKPCSDHCYLRLKDVTISSKNSTPGSFQDKDIKIIEELDGTLAPSCQKELGNQSSKVILKKETHNYVTTPITIEVDCHEDLNSNVSLSESRGKQKISYLPDSVPCDSTLPPDESQNSHKKLKRILENRDTTIGDYNKDLNLDSCNEENYTITCASMKSFVEHASNKLIVSGSTSRGVDDVKKDVTNEVELKQLSYSMEEQVDEMPSISDWKPLEKELYLKGIEMFGRNSCLIYRNLLSGLKTCMEVATYMHAEVSMAHRSMDENGKFDAKCTDHEIPSRSRSLRRKGKARKFKYSSKSAGLPSMWKRMTDGNDQTLKQYTPCGCKGMCGKECPCLLNGSCCEKYCGCSKHCRIRFRGCHCVKSQCRSRQCPCFAASRECDPDVCRNCWVSCGDGSLGEQPRRGDGQCGNMKILLRQKQRILLAKSDIAGWGAFLKNPINKNDYLGEYTGELVSPIEAEKRGKLYDRADFSFLFGLNDQYILDAYRKGDKLKFANHSSEPNCYAKIMLVSGDHRVGIFAQKRIEAGEELFYDYHYAPNHSPPWFLKLSTNGSKKKEPASSQGKAKKNQSN